MTNFDNNRKQQRGSNFAMRDKMERIRPSIHTRQNFVEPYKNVMNWVEDGVDHINISAFGKTGLGQALSHASPVPFKHSIFGRFGSMESFWHYIQSEEQDDRIRNMSSYNIKNFGAKLTRRMVTNFRAIIMDSNYQRIMQNPKLMEAVKESSLPFDCYYTESNTGLRKRLTYFHWLLSGFEEIRNAIKEGRPANFDNLKDDQKSEIYDFVKPRTNTVVDNDPKKGKTRPYDLLKSFIDTKDGTQGSEQANGDQTGEVKKKKKKKKKHTNAAPQVATGETSSDVGQSDTTSQEQSSQTSDDAQQPSEPGVPMTPDTPEVSEQTSSIETPAAVSETPATVDNGEPVVNV